jgi:hypothetical protein
MNHLKRYCEYIRNTAKVPLPADMFDDDWEPIGPMVRRDMTAADLITEDQSGIRLTEAGKALL